ncbi:MAG: methyltransferase domain-containing protein [Rhodocyclaceae bacterium]
MYANSHVISSAQTGPHDKLDACVLRHRDSVFRKPIADYNRSAFEAALGQWDGRAPLVLDAGCGVGWSTLNLAREWPDHFVIGVDQSADRLARGKPAVPPNACFVRADLTDFWRLWQQHGLPLARHYLLYPNPWPKIGHLARRWHGMAVFPNVVALGGRLECRTNWRIYAEEFARAVHVLSGVPATAEPWVTASPMTPFERKYRDSGQALYRVVVDLPRPVRDGEAAR